MAAVDTQMPLKMIVSCIFCGGLAAGEARRAPCTAKNQNEKSAMSGEDTEWKARKAETDLIQR